MSSRFLSSVPIAYMVRLKRSINYQFVGSVPIECERLYTSKGIPEGMFMPDAHFYTSTFETVHESGGTEVDQVDLAIPVQLGITLPDSELTAAAGAAGNLTGGYYYKVTYRNAGGFESNASDASTIETMAGEKCELSAIPRSSDPQVTQRRIYRTEGGGTVYKLLVTIDNNYETTYSDNIADGSLGATLETDHDVPEVMSEIHSHKSLLRGVEAAEKNIVWWANAFDEWEYFDVTNYDTFGSTSDESQAIETLSDSMVVVQKHKVWNLNTMEEPEELAQSLASRGVPNPKACWNAGEVLIMVDNSGIFLYDKLTDVCISGPIEPLFDAEGTHTRRINEDYATNLCTCTLNDKVLISYTSVLESAIVNDTTLIFDKRNGIFQGIIPVGFSDFTVNKTDKIIYGAGTDGIIYKLETGIDDEGTDIDWHFQTKDFITETGGIGVLKRGNIAKIDCNPNGGTITIDVYLDGVSSQTVTVTGDDRTVKRWRLPVDVDFYRISFKVSGSGQQYVYGIMFTFKELGF